MKTLILIFTIISISLSINTNRCLLVIHNSDHGLKKDTVVTNFDWFEYMDNGNVAVIYFEKHHPVTLNTNSFAPYYYELKEVNCDSVIIEK